MTSRTKTTRWVAMIAKDDATDDAGTARWWRGLWGSPALVFYTFRA